MIAVSEESAGYRPCLILAHTDPAYAAEVCRSFRRQGWDVYRATGGPEVRRLARMLGAEQVVVDTELPDESGWLTCDKLTRERPGVKVVLVSPLHDPRAEKLAAFVGARALVNRHDGVPALLRQVCGTTLPAAG